MIENGITVAGFCEEDKIIVLKELQVLYEFYGNDEYRVKIDLFKNRILTLIKNEKFSLEKELEGSAERFGEVYAAQPVTCEVYFIFSISFKQVKNISKASKYAEKAVFLIEKIGMRDENTCKYWVSLATIYALKLNHGKSLDLLRKSKKLLKVLLSESVHEKMNENLLVLLGINLFNIAAEEEGLKNYAESVKQYKKTLELYDLYPQLQSENMRLRISNCIERVALIIDSKNVSRKGNSTKNRSCGWSSNFSSVKATSRIKLAPKKKSNLCKPTVGFTTRGFSNPQKDVKKNQNYCKNKYKPEEKYSKSGISKDSFSKNLKSLQGSRDFEPSINISQSSNKTLSKNCSYSTKPASFSQYDLKKIDCAPSKNVSFDFQINVLIPIKEKSEGNATPLQEIIDEKFSVANESEVECEGNSAKLEMLSLIEQENDGEEESVSIFYKCEDKSLFNESLVSCPVTKTCIHRADIEFDLKSFKSIYKLKNSLNQLSITCKNNEEKYHITLEVPKNIAFFDYIRENIHPCLAIKDNNLIIAQKEFLLLATGNIEREEYTGWIKVSRVYPRWAILVEIQNDSKYFDLNQILPSLENFSETIKDPKFFFSLFDIKDQSIIVELPVNYPFILLSEKSIQLEKHNVNFEIFQVKYIKSYSFLIQGKNEDYALSPLLIDYSFLANLSKNSKLTLGKILNYLGEVLRASKSSEIYIDKSIEYQVMLSPIRESLKSSLVFHELKPSENKVPSLNLFPVESCPSIESQSSSKDSTKNLPSLKLLPNHSSFSKHDKKYLKESERSCQSSAFSELPNYETIFNSGKNLEYKDYENRIILRFSVYQNSKIFQVFMNFSDENILTFVIESGPARENRKSYSIEVQMLCDKIGFEKKYIVPLGSYILRNLLVIKDSDICYFDFTKPIRNPSTAIDKIAGLLKGFICRKRFRIKLRNLIGKRKARFSGNIYTVLVYKDHDTLHLRLVSGFKVLGLCLNFLQIVKNKLFSSIDQFFNSFGELGLKVLPDSESLWIKPEYLILN